MTGAVRRGRVVLHADDPAILTRAATGGLGLSALPGFLADNEPDLGQRGVHLVIRTGAAVLRGRGWSPAGRPRSSPRAWEWLTRPRATRTSLDGRSHNRVGRVDCP